MSLLFLDSRVAVETQATAPQTALSQRLKHSAVDKVAAAD